MAAPHVAGVAALYLETNAALTPSQVQVQILASATLDVVTNLAGSPNRLLYTGDITGSDGSLPEATQLNEPSSGYRYFDGGSFGCFLLFLLLL
jgi:subtilisin family serine protease